MTQFMNATNKPLETHTADNDCPPPYHLFICQGEHFVYDTSTARFYRIDALAYRLLEECLTCDLPEAKTRLIAQQAANPEAIEEVAREAAALGELGLFDTPDYRISP